MNWRGKAGQRGRREIRCFLWGRWCVKPYKPKRSEPKQVLAPWRTTYWLPIRSYRTHDVAPDMASDMSPAVAAGEAPAVAPAIAPPHLSCSGTTQMCPRWTSYLHHMCPRGTSSCRPCSQRMRPHRTPSRSHRMSWAPRSHWMWRTARPDRMHRSRSSRSASNRRDLSRRRPRLRHVIRDSRRSQPAPASAAVPDQTAAGR